MATDFSYASGSGVYDLRAGEYDIELVEALGMDYNKLSEILPSTEVLGTLTPKAEWVKMQVLWVQLQQSAPAYGQILIR